MIKLTTVCLATLLAANLAQASTPCDGFEIKIKNTLPDTLIAKLNFSGAELQPGGFQSLPGNSEQVFTINNSAANVPMSGVFEFYTATLPVKKVEIAFDLNNETLVCHHNEISSGGDYKVEKTRLPGKVDYTIG